MCSALSTNGFETIDTPQLAAGKFIIEKFRYEGDQIYAIKLITDSFLCFFYDGAKIIVTNAYEKKFDKMPASEKQKALKAKDDYIMRCKKGTYYDEKN